MPGPEPESPSPSSSTSTITDPFLLAVLSSLHASQSSCTQLIDNASVTLSSAPETSRDTTTSLQSELLASRRKDLSVHMGRLRGLNRSIVHRVRETKAKTSDARGEVDMLHLLLQNLYYEQRHLRGEIAACEGYDHKFESLPLVPVAEFLALQPELRDADESTLMEARINHEHAEREALEAQRQGLLRKKQSLIAENKKRKDDLASLDQDLEKFIDAAKPIQKIFEKEY